jgi:hypothetical protein
MRMSPFLKATMPHLNPKLINHMKKLINRRDHCPPESVCRKTRKSLTQLKPPLVGILPGATLQLQFLDLLILLHLQRNRGFTLDTESAAPSPQVSTVQVDSDGFKTVTYKKKTATGASAVNTVKPLIGVRNSFLLPIISKETRSKALFVLRFSPEVSSGDLENSLKEKLSLKKLVCTRLKTKFNTYASFHFSVIEDEFLLINNTGVWPTGYLIAPSYGKLTPDQVYSSSTPVTGETTLPVASDTVNKCV